MDSNTDTYAEELDTEFIDEVIPIKECTDFVDDIWNVNNKIYCPDFDSNTFFFGD